MHRNRSQTLPTGPFPLSSAIGVLSGLLILLGAGTATAQAAPPTVPEVRFDRVQGVVIESHPQQKRLIVKMPGGKTQAVRIADNAWLHTLRQLDERERAVDPKAVD